MPINKNSLQARINNLANKTGVHQNILLKSFFFDAFLKRLSLSKYSDQFVFKGGFLLSTSLGINFRSTQDIDFLLRKVDLDIENIKNLLNEIASLDAEDNIVFTFQNIKEIKPDDEYGGYNITFVGKFENIAESISIDVATGDPITPAAVDYKYKCLLNNEVLHFKAYNFETILAEKLQTILTRGVLNSRSKDFYDLYIIHNLRWDDIIINNLKNAFAKTCIHRKTFFQKNEAIQILDNIRNDEQMNLRWKSYRKKNYFVGDVSFDKTVDVALLIVQIIF